MALIKCPECGKDISDKSRSCVHCGYIFPNEHIVKQNKMLIPILICFAFATIVVVIIALYATRDMRAYHKAQSLEQLGKYSEALEIYATIIDYEDVTERVDECNFQLVLADESKSIFYNFTELDISNVISICGEPSEVYTNDNSIDYVYSNKEFLGIDGELTIRFWSYGSVIYARWVVDGDNYHDKTEYSSDLEKVELYFSSIYEYEKQLSEEEMEWQDYYTDHRIWLHLENKSFDVEFRPW